LVFTAGSDSEFNALTRQHLDCVLQAYRQADVFIFTLGLTESWISKFDGAVYPACPGTIAGEYDSGRHAFRNFSATEVTQDLMAAFSAIRSINPRVRFIVTVSPVPLVATATGRHVLEATIYSKSALRVAAHEVTCQMARTSYFPAYEIVTGPQAPHNFFAANRRDVTREAISTVMSTFLGGNDANLVLPELEPIEEALQFP